MISILEVDGLKVERGTAAILRGIDWRIARGQHWVLLGANGCGKTSLLKSIIGYFSPTSGTIRVLGKTYGQTDWRDLRLQIGLVTSALQASIPPAEVAEDTVASGRYAQLDLWVKTTAVDRKDARRWMRFLGIDYLAGREWLYLSQGERQRVLIARSLMANPKILILDEPCAGLDPVAREHFLQFVERLAHKRGGPALVLVTHHVEEITPGFTHALVLRGGAVLAKGRVKEVLNNRTLSAAFGARITLSRLHARYTAQVRWKAPA
jgi:iron complex transport system ATP-binding protein